MPKEYQYTCKDTGKTVKVHQMQRMSRAAACSAWFSAPADQKVVSLKHGVRRLLFSRQRMAHSCGAKHMCKSKCTTPHFSQKRFPSPRAFFQVQMSTKSKVRPMILMLVKRKCWTNRSWSDVQWCWSGTLWHRVFCNKGLVLCREEQDCGSL